MLRRIAMRCWRENRSLKEAILEDEEASSLIREEELEEWLRPEGYLGTAVEQVEMVTRSLRETWLNE